jgi:GTP cyclohydrolase IIa
MIQLTIIRIEGYGPWTLTLGSDRESQLQMLQAKIYHDVQRLFSEKKGIVYFNRFDEFFAITNGFDIEDHEQIQRELTKTYKNLILSMTVGSGANAFEANIRAHGARKYKKMFDRNARIFGSCDSSNLDTVQILHIDIDSSTKVADNLSPYEVTSLVTRIHSGLVEEFLKYNSLTFFLGGDNFMVISNGMTKEQIDSAIKKATTGINIKFNCGIGVGKTGRGAAEAATKALDTIRDLRKEGKIQPIYEVRCHP